MALNLYGLSTEHVLCHLRAPGLPHSPDTTTSDATHFIYAASLAIPKTSI
jgi:hypothetical protein